MSEVNLSHADNEINSAIARGEIIGGALDPEIGRIVPVELKWIELEDDAANDYRLGSFQTPDGRELALLAHVFPGRHTRQWRLTEAAASAGYEETEIPVIGGGRGVIHHWTDDGVHTAYPVEDATHGPQVNVHARAGEGFMFEGASDSQIGVWVLSLITRAFKLPYEEIVRGSSSEEVAEITL